MRHLSKSQLSVYQKKQAKNPNRLGFSPYMIRNAF